jgi:hypothetical protein
MQENCGKRTTPKSSSRKQLLPEAMPPAEGILAKKSHSNKISQNYS